MAKDSARFFGLDSVCLQTIERKNEQQVTDKTSKSEPTKSHRSGASKSTKGISRTDQVVGVQAQISHNQAVIHKLSSERRIEAQRRLKASQSSRDTGLERPVGDFRGAQGRRQQLCAESQFFCSTESLETGVIAKLESLYSVELPEDYRAFLRAHGSGTFAPLPWRSLKLIAPEKLLNPPFSHWIRWQKSKVLPILQCDTGDVLALMLAPRKFQSLNQENRSESRTPKSPEGLSWIHAKQFYQPKTTAAEEQFKGIQIAKSFSDWLKKFITAEGDYYWLSESTD